MRIKYLSILISVFIVSSLSFSALAQDGAANLIKKNDVDGGDFNTPKEFRARFSGDQLARGERRRRGGGGRRGRRQQSSEQELGGSSGQRDRVTRDFKHMDEDGDQRISRAEWKRRGNFDRLDTNSDGYLNEPEVRVHYRKSLPNYRPDAPGEAPDAIGGAPDEDALAAKVSSSEISGSTICGMVRRGGCAPNSAVDVGMVETGLGPKFPDGLYCHGVDDYWAMDYSYKRNRQAWHGGIDLPTDWGTPMLAVADGTVVAVFEGEDSKRGKEIILRHSPGQTSIPFWTYSGYAHLDALPPFKPGQRIKKGQVLGPTGNSGIGGMSRSKSTRRRAAIHFSIVYSESPNYAIIDDVIVPVNGRWMDPVGFYRRAAPYESNALKALPETEKFVAIPVKSEDGTFVPEDTKLIWPYACKKD